MVTNFVDDVAAADTMATVVADSLTAQDTPIGELEDEIAKTAVFEDYYIIFGDGNPQSLMGSNES